MSKKIKIGYQGLTGAYHEKAARTFFRNKGIEEENVDFISFSFFEEIFDSVEKGELDYGIVAIENSLMGSIHKNFDLLKKHSLKIVGEEYVHVKHQLYSLKSAKKEDIKEIVSQYMALLQCDEKININFPGVKRVEYFDTIAASKYIKESKDKNKACISPEGVGEKYGLKRLVRDFNDDINNYTRFFIISKNYANLKKEKQKNFYKTSIIFAGANIAGFLFKALACFSLRDINLSKIESRPVPKSPWNYYFYLDFEGKFDDENIANAIENLKQIANEVRVLGSFKAEKV